MRVACRSALLGAAALAVLLAFGGTAHAQSKCHAGKLKCVTKKKSCLLGLKAKELGSGVAIDPAKALKCRVGFGGSCDAGANVGALCHNDTECPGGTCAKGCFTKLEAKVPTPPDLPCPTSGDSQAIENKIEAFVTDVENELDLTPGANLQACQAAKIKCVIGKDKCVLGVWGKAAQAGTPPDPAKLGKCFAKFGGTCDAGGNVGAVCVQNSECPGGTCAGGCFTKAETKPPCQTTGDAPALEAKIDAFDNDIISELASPPSCPTKIEFVGTSTDGILDTGWTGNGHDATVISNGKVTVAVSGCTNAVPPCGVCTYSGPIANTSGLQSQRCVGGANNTKPCTAASVCPGGSCKFFFGSYLPLAAGGVSTCVENTFAGGISGTADMATGDSTGLASVTSRVFNGITLSNPCPRCVSGSCDAGPNMGSACTVSGSSPNASFGSTSLDCPPAGGALIATLPINLNNTTATFTRTLAAANPSCTAGGWTTNKCQCDTCDDAASTPCAANADCPIPGGICGGLRCTGGSNVGAPCPTAGASSVCPGAACGRKGTATAANQCDGGSGDCAADPGTPSPNDRKCVTGPNENFCTPVETFRGCGADSDCPFAGDTCTLSRFRDCFDNGTLGETVKATGQPDPPVAHMSDPKLAAMFCIGPTTSASVNNAAGLPGLGRLELTGHAVDNGTP